MVLAIAQPEPGLHAEIEALRGLCIFVPDKPRLEVLEFEAPAIIPPKRNLHFQVGCHHGPQRKVGLYCPGRILVLYLALFLDRDNDRDVRVIVLMDDDPSSIVKAIGISKKCMRIVYENIYFAIGIKVACLILGAVGIANMWIAIFADVGVMVIAVLNAIRALSVKKYK